MGLVEIDDRDGDIPSDLGYLDLGAQRTFEIPDQLIADGLTPGQYPSLERGIAAFNFAKNVIDQVLLLQQPRMRRAAGARTPGVSLTAAALLLRDLRQGGRLGHRQLQGLNHIH